MTINLLKPKFSEWHMSLFSNKPPQYIAEGGDESIIKWLIKGRNTDPYFIKLSERMGCCCAGGEEPKWAKGMSKTKLIFDSSVGN